MYNLLEEINKKPQLYSVYNPEDLWNDKHISKVLLEWHLNKLNDLASRNIDFVKKSSSYINKRFNLEGKKVLDLGCGPGLYSKRFAKFGANVTGIDLSENSLNYAKSVIKDSNTNINYILGDYTKIDFGEGYDIITLIYCDICALPPVKRKKLLNKIHKALNSNGAFIFDAFSNNSFVKLIEHSEYSKNLHNGFWSSEDYYGFMNTFLYNKEHVELGKYTIITTTQTKIIYNWLKYFTPKEIKEELNSSGFTKIEILGDLTGKEYDPQGDEFGVIAY